MRREQQLDNMISDNRNLSIKLSNAQAEIERLSKEREEYRQGRINAEINVGKLVLQLETVNLQVHELEQRIYKIGLLCDSVPGLEHGFCPDVGEPRDNVTRIKIALERFIEKRKDGA